MYSSGLAKAEVRPEYRTMDPARRSKRVYLWVPVVFLALAVPSVWLLVTGLSNLTEGLIRFTAPGRAQIAIEEPGTYTVFHEYRSTFGGRVYSGPSSLPGMNIQMRGPGGVFPIVRSSSGNFTYNVGSSAGYAVGSVKIERTGGYEVTSVFTGGEGDQVVLGLGRDKGKSTFQSVGGVFGLIGAFGLAFVTWLLIFVVRSARSRSTTSGPYSSTPPDS